MTLIPFQNETDSIGIGQLTVENRLDRVSLYGSLDITADSEGFANAIVLHALLSDVLAEFERKQANGNLLERVEIQPTVDIENPFIKQS